MRDSTMRGWVARIVDAELLQRLLHHRQLVVRVVDDEVARQADVRRLPPQQPGAERVEGRDPHAPAVGVEQALDAGPHLFRRLVGEGDGEDRRRVGEPLADKVGDAVRDDARLARPGARENEQRPVGLQDGLPLFRVEAETRSIAGRRFDGRPRRARASAPRSRPPPYSTVTLLARLRG